MILATHTSSTKKGNLIIHPTLAGKNIYDSVDAEGNHFIRQMCAQRTGQIFYPWRNPGEESAREKVVVFRHIPEVKWIVADGVYLDELHRPLMRLKAAMWATGVITLTALLLSLFLVGTAMTRPLRKLMDRIGEIWSELGLGTDASQVANGMQNRSRDEIRRLTRRFDDLAISIRLRDRQLADYRQDLEQLVAERTAQLTARNEEMGIVLDTIDQGLVTVDRDGHLGAERSAAFREWFGVPDREAPFWHCFAPPDANLSLMFELGWESVLEDVLPLDVAFAQLPRRFERGDRSYALACKPILGQSAELLRVLLIISDITAEVEQLARETEQKEFLAVFERLMRDKAGFIEFFNEASRLTDQLAIDPPKDDAVLARSVHTLKGNAAIFGVHSVADVCHLLEDRAAEAGVAAMREALPLLVNRWASFAQRVVPLIGTRAETIVEVESRDLEALAEGIRKRVPSTALLAAIDKLRAEPVLTRFQRIAEQAQGIANRLGKGRLQINIEHNDIRLPAERWAGFWGAFLHVVRNAVDHGLELPDERQRTGKSVAPVLSLRAVETQRDYIVEIRDDGRGIDWDALAAKAAEHGMHTGTREDLVEALFRDGISTKGQVTDLSGRGVGMGAVREATYQLGGSIVVESEPGCGTRLIFRVPIHGNSRAPVGSVRAGVRPTLVPPRAISVPCNA